MRKRLPRKHSKNSPPPPLIYGSVNHSNHNTPNSRNPTNVMKKSGILNAASVAAASTTAAAAAVLSSSLRLTNSNTQRSKQEDDLRNDSMASSEKFAPRFDGLRFIETLVTAHR